MKIPTIYNRNERSLDVAMTPMIDVVFLLLIFFVWTASFQVVEYLLPSKISAQTGTGADAEIPPELIDLEQVVVRLIANETAVQWIMNDEILDGLTDVEARLVQVASIRNDIPVIVDPEKQVRLGDVINVYDAAMRAGFDSIQFTTSAE